MLHLRSRPLLGFSVLLALAACGASDPEESAPVPSAPEPEATSLLGAPLYPPQLSAERLRTLEQNIATARAELAARPGTEDAIVWLGRRLAYAGRYREAIAVFSDGLESHPDSAKLLRHRGHRFITLRRFDDAIADLARASELARDIDDEIEPDGIPNRENRPLSTLKFNIWYHLGLAHYLRGDFEQALAAYRECLEHSNNPDLLVATTDWLYMTLRRLGRDNEAKHALESISPDLVVIENDSYLKRLRLYRGETTADEVLAVAGGEDPDLAIATQGYGVGNWFLYNGERERAREVFEQVTAGSSWAAFGFIAAEAELARWPRE